MVSWEDGTADNTSGGGHEGGDSASEGSGSGTRTAILTSLNATSALMRCIRFPVLMSRSASKSATPASCITDAAGLGSEGPSQPKKSQIAVDPLGWVNVAALDPEDLPDEVRSCDG